MRFYVHYICDCEKDLEFIFEFEYPKSGFVGLVDDNKRYLEVDGVANTATICPFDPEKEYMKY